jgi:YbbR domain-containing protein
MTAEAKVTHRLRRMLLQNLGLKLFSLMVSIGLFAAVHGSEAGQRSLDVPVVAVLPPESSGKVLVGEIPDSVKVTLSGSRSVLNSINRVDAVQVDIREAPSFYAFEAQAFGLPTGIAVDVNPAVLRLRWEPRTERKVPVRANFAGQLSPAFELSTKVGVTPAHLNVRGPRSKIEALNDVLTDAISLSDLGLGSHRRHVSLALPHHVTTSDALDVVVEFAVEARKEQRRMKKLPIAVLGSSGPVQVRPQNVDVIVSAPERTLAELDPEHIVPVIDLTEENLGPGASPVQVRLRGLSDSVRLIRIEPSEVFVRAR